MDQWRTIDVHNAKLSFDGKSDVIVNVLEVIAKGRMADLEITGLTNSLHRAKKPKQSNASSRSLQPITITSPQYYSIGVKPTCLWIGANSTWYSIHFSKKYNMVWQNVVRVNSLFFAISGYYEEDPGRLQLPIEQQMLEVMVQHAIELGEGCTVKDVLVMIHENREFLLLHIGRELEYKAIEGTEIRLKESGVYKWITNYQHSLKHLKAAQCLDLDFLESYIQITHDATYNGDGSDSEMEDVLDPDGDVQMGDVHEIADDNLDVDPAQGNAVDAGPKPPHKGLYVSPQFPAGTLPTTYVDAFIAIAYNCASTGREGKSLATMSAASVGFLVYRDYSIARNETAKRLLEDSAKTIYNALTPSFQNAKLGQDLLRMPTSQGPIKCNMEKHDKRANEQYRALVSGTEVLKQRGSTNVTGRMENGKGKDKATRKDMGKGKGKDDGREGSANVAEERMDVTDESRDVVQKHRTPGFINGKAIPKPIRRSTMYSC